VTSIPVLAEEDISAAGEARRVLSRRWFSIALVGLVILGVGARLLFIVRWMYGKPLLGDPLFFQDVGASLSHGMGYVVPFLSQGKQPTALHPPVFPVVLGSLDLVGIQSANAHRIALAFISAGCIPVMGLLGRRLLSPIAGLIAAGIAAVGPLWIQPSGKVLSESVYLVVIPVVLLAALRCLDRPSGWRFLLLGLAIGVAALTESEAVTFILLLGIPLVLFVPVSWNGRAKLGLVLLAGFCLVVGPWLIRNEVQMGGFVFSTDMGTTLVGANTADTFNPNSFFYGSTDGTDQVAETIVTVNWGHPPDHARRWTERTLNNALAHTGISYARAHLTDLPGVMLAREGRLWGLYDTGSQLQQDIDADGDGVRSVQLVGQYLNWVLLPLAVAGGVVLYRRSRRNLVIVTVPIVAAVINAALAFGSTRYRAIAEPSLALLAAVAIAALIQSVVSRNRRRHHGGTAVAEDPFPQVV
jgi:4-amino-4-deoxy-L-arabinose transferase-like glycosyltransferase